MAPLLFLLHVFFIRLPGGDSVRTFGYLTAQSGESLNIPCFYDKKYKDHVKYWCRGQLWSSCTIMARTDSPQSSSKVSITDSPAQLIFHVTMRNLKTSDTGTYWCAVEIGGTGQMDDCQSLLIEVNAAQSVRTVSWVSAERGGSVTISCYYDQKYKDHVKYWCRGRDWNFCSILARSDSNQPAGKVSISDDPAHLVFNVTMRNLQETDSDTYWCAVEIHGAGDDGVCLQLMVMEARAVSPKQAELTTALQQTESFTSSTQHRENFTSATKDPTGWAGTTYPSGALISTTNEDSNITQSPSQMLLLLMLVLLLLLVATVMVIWILQSRTKTTLGTFYFTLLLVWSTCFVLEWPSSAGETAGSDHWGLSPVKGSSSVSSLGRGSDCTDAPSDPASSCDGHFLKSGASVRHPSALLPPLWGPALILRCSAHADSLSLNTNL